MKKEVFDGCDGLGRNSFLFLKEKVPYGQEYYDVREELSRLDWLTRQMLLLMVISDRLYSWFDSPQGVADKPFWAEEIRRMARELGFIFSPYLNSKSWDVSLDEAKGYFDGLAQTGIVEALEDGGWNRTDIYCTLSECASAVLGQAVKPQEMQGYVATAHGGGPVDWSYVLTPGTKWVFPEGF